ncbi:DUF4253 domain-containing protein [Nocardia jejuensis]|uniref:DUF4253 domain-containing protein n=1 Tax=Nocardia jejuensis TaxID=328049 RepID=UPI001471A96E|nr:DUF4253 domain-containing protein [Nocardia jejuensis]
MLNSLGVKPFRPDADPAPAVEVVAGDLDPTELYATLGIELPPLTRVAATLDGHPVWMAQVETGYPATDLWQRVRAVYARTGLWPLLIAPRALEGLEEFEPEGERENTAAPIESEGAAWLERAVAADPGEVASVPRSTRDLTDEDRDHEGFGWDDAWNVIDDDSDQLILVPAAHPWLVPYLLNWWGACNHDLNGMDHAALLRRWAGHWGAELVALSLDTLTLRVANPPVDDDAALSVALERFLYCSDQVHQGAGTLDELKPLAAAPLWRFWWD